MNTREQVRSLLATSFLLTDDVGTLADDGSLFDQNIIDSAGILELVMLVEKTFGIEVRDEEIVPENFDSVNCIVDYISAQQPKPHVVDPSNDHAG